MAVTPIPGKPGLYRHTQTGFIVHEVWNLDQLLKCNGALFEKSSNAVFWAWYAGRDLNDLIISSGASDINGLLDHAMGVSFMGRTLRDESAVGLNQVIPAAFICKDSQGYAWNRPDRVFGLVTGLDAGFGTALELSVYSTTSILGKSTGNSYGTDFYFRRKMTSPVDGDIVGGGLVAVASKYTWRDLMNQFYAAQEHANKAEVAEKITKAKIRVEAYLKDVMKLKLDQLAKFTFYVTIAKNGKVKYVPPYSTIRYQYASNSEGATKYELQRRYGVRAYCNDNRGITVPVGLAPSASQGIGSPLYSTQDVTTQGTSDAAEIAWYDALQEITHFDNVRIERVMGGVVGARLSDTGEKDLVQGFNLETQAVIRQYLDTIVLAPTGLSPRPVDNGGTPVTDGVWAQQLEAGWGAVTDNSWIAQKFSTYDTHGFGFGLFLAICTMALEPGKAKRRTICLYEQSRRPPMGDLSVATAAGSVNNFLFANDSGIGPKIQLVTVPAVLGTSPFAGLADVPA